MDQYAEEAMYVAGGTDLIPNMKHRLFEPTHLIALKSVSELSGIREENGYLRIGAAETLAEVARHQEVRKLFPALSDAAGHIAGPQLRNSGTIGGNLCLDTDAPTTIRHHFGVVHWAIALRKTARFATLPVLVRNVSQLTQLIHHQYL